MDTARDRIMLFTGARWENGYALGTSDSFDLVANAWNPEGTHPRVPSEVSALPGSPMVEDPSAGDVYAFPSWTVARWNASSNDWTMLLEDTAFSQDSALSALDTTRGRVLFVGGDSEVARTYTLATNEMADVELGGDSGEVAGAGSDAMVYVEAIDRYLVRLEGAGPTVYAIDPATFEVTSFATTGGDAVPETINGVWRRFLYVPRLHGCVYVPEYETDVWFIRVH
jgi:hypothetical protein